MRVHQLFLEHKYREKCRCEYLQLIGYLDKVTGEGERKEGEKRKEVEEEGRGREWIGKR